MSYIGCISGKYKHLLCFKPFIEIAAETTLKEYEKNGVKVEKLGEHIYPSGKVWLPTSEKYLVDYCNILNSITGKQNYNVLDIGCGSGILSFLFAKSQKKSQIYAIDKNPDAVKTTNLNAARIGMKNIEAF
jgi:methylase of polypeptide subunit release factors